MAADTVPETAGALGNRPHWGWLVALGVVFLALGLFAAVHLLASTVASVLVVGSLMIVGGAAQIVGAFRAQGWGRTLLWIAAGVLYVLAGVFAFLNPLLASAVLTLVFAFFLMFAGVARLVFGFGVKPVEGWGWVVASGAITLLAGVLIASGWPATLWVLGLVLAFDLVSQGASYLAIGLASRKRG